MHFPTSPAYLAYVFSMAIGGLMITQKQPVWQFRSTQSKTPPGELIPVDMAVQKGLGLAHQVEHTELIDLVVAQNRVLAENVLTSFPQPLFDCSAMDGYAVQRVDLTGKGPWHLKISHAIEAGDPGETGAPPGHAVRILTGAPVPACFDAVIMQEHVQREGDVITVAKLPRHGENIRKCGEDLTAGTIVLDAGTRLAASQLALAASTGAPELRVFRKVRVAFFSTGSELKQPGETLEPGQIYNSNRYMLRGQLGRNDVEMIDMGTLPDDPELLASALADARRDADIIISTGGVSVGDADYMPGLVQQAGGILHVLKVAMKPGKPVTIGTLGDAVYVGLPGNPFAAFMTYFLIARPIIDKCAGLRGAAARTIPAVCGFTRRRRLWRREYLPVKTEGFDTNGRPLLTLLGSGSSAALLPMAQADGLAIIEAGEGSMQAGESIFYIPL
jgi:molybdopterin molybdotransferase